MKSLSIKNKAEQRTSTLLSILVVVVLILPLFISLWRESRIFMLTESDHTLINFVKNRYLNSENIIIDIICSLAVIAVIFFMVRIDRRIKTSRMFVNMASAANVPIFVINSSNQIYWTNIDTVKLFNGIYKDNCIKQIIGNENAQKLIDKCRNDRKPANYEIEMKTPERKLWLHVTISNVKYHGDDKMICGTISDISNLKEASEKIDNQQRELQMQNEMLTLITAQMEVQQAGIKEQNDVLSSQHKLLEEQADELKSAFNELEIRNKQIITKTSYITDSIKYAQTIQEAILPDDEMLSGFFDNFIIYRPKDIVSGDFYWMSENPKYTYVVLGDCTGHGVPGAFMSMIGIRILGELINEQKMERPSVILEAMNEKIKTALKQDTTENTDGIDIAICRFSKNEDGDHDWDLKYAGAKQPIFIVKKGNQETEVIEANRRGVGGQDFSEVFFFEDQDIKLNNGDRVYLTSDGIKDQNNIMRKRFSTARFKKMLNITYTERIQDQKQFINSIITNWQGLEEQRDDLSLWGLELSDKKCNL